MKNVIGWIADYWYVPIFVALMYLMWTYGESQYDRGHSAAQAKGDKAVADLREEHQKLRADAAEQNLVLYRQQVERANQAELVFLDAQDEIGRLKQQLTQERINRVSTQYTPARGAAEPTPALKKRPGPPPALTPNYWKAALPQQTSWPMRVTTAPGPSPTWRS